MDNKIEGQVGSIIVGDSAEWIKQTGITNIYSGSPTMFLPTKKTVLDVFVQVGAIEIVYREDSQIQTYPPTNPRIYKERYVAKGDVIVLESTEDGVYVPPVQEEETYYFNE